MARVVPTHYIAACLIYLSSGSLYFFTFFSALWLAILFGFGVFLAVNQRRVLVDRSLLIYAFTSTALFFGNGLLFREGLATNIGIALKILGCLLIVAVIKHKLVDALILVTYHFAIGSLLMFVDLNTFGIVTGRLSGLLPEFQLNQEIFYNNFVFFAEMSRSSYGLVEFTSGRNGGIFWEPGAYQVILNIALALHLNTVTKIDKISVVLIATILSTFSTTGYIVLTIVISLFSVRHGLSVKKILLFAAIIVFAFLFGLYSKHGFEKLNLVLSYFGSPSVEIYGSQWRVFDTVTDLLMFADSPIVGHGPNMSEAIQSPFKGERTGSSNSLTFFLSSYGMFVSLFFLYPVFSRRFRSLFGPFRVLFWIQMSVAAFIVSPLIISLLCLSFIKKPMPSR